MMKKNKIIQMIAILTIILIFIDQISKILITVNCKTPIGDGILRITRIENTGMAFGMNDGNTKNMILTAFILCIILNFIRNQKERIDRKTAVAISFILAGGMSNLLDRILRGGVVDFIELKNFAIFNIADCYVVAGWILLVFFLIKFNKEMMEEKGCEKQ